MQFQISLSIHKYIAYVLNVNSVHLFNVKSACHSVFLLEQVISFFIEIVVNLNHLCCSCHYKFSPLGGARRVMSTVVFIFGQMSVHLYHSL